MTPFDSYEIHGVHEFNEDGRKFCEQVPDDQASFWTLYGHIPGEGAMAIGDFDSREHAEEAFQRITGVPFSGASEVKDRVRVMHAGPRLLEALKTILPEADAISHHTPHLGADFWDEANAAVAEAVGRAV